MTILPDPNSKAGLISTVMIGTAGGTAPYWLSTMSMVESGLTITIQILSLLYITTMIIRNIPEVIKIIKRGFGPEKDEENGE